MSIAAKQTVEMSIAAECLSRGVRQDVSSSWFIPVERRRSKAFSLDSEAARPADYVVNGKGMSVTFFPRMQTGSADWQSGLCDCCAQPGGLLLCCCACWCPCIVYGDNAGSRCSFLWIAKACLTTWITQWSWIQQIILAIHVFAFSYSTCSTFCRYL